MTERSDLFLPFLRHLLQNAPRNFHMCVVPMEQLDSWYQQSKWGVDVEFDQKDVENLIHSAPGTIVGNFVIFLFGHDVKEKVAAPSFSHSCGSDLLSFTDRSGSVISPGVTFDDICVGTTEHVSISLDAQGRSMYIAVMRKENVTDMRTLNDSELLDLWSSAMAAADPTNECECCDPTGNSLSSIAMSSGVDNFTDVRINCGSYQNIGHLHLKVSMPSSSFFEQWQFHESWLRLVEHTPNARLKQTVCRHIKNKEKEMSERNDEVQFWTENRMLRLTLGLQLWPPATLEEKEKLLRPPASGKSGGKDIAAHNRKKTNTKTNSKTKNTSIQSTKKHDTKSAAESPRGLNNNLPQKNQQKNQQQKGKQAPKQQGKQTPKQQAPKQQTPKQQSHQQNQQQKANHQQQKQQQQQQSYSSNKSSSPSKKNNNPAAPQAKKKKLAPTSTKGTPTKGTPTKGTLIKTAVAAARAAASAKKKQEDQRISSAKKNRRKRGGKKEGGGSGGGAGGAGEGGRGGGTSRSSGESKKSEKSEKKKDASGSEFTKAKKSGGGETKGKKKTPKKESK